MKKSYLQALTPTLPSKGEDTSEQLSSCANSPSPKRGEHVGWDKRSGATHRDPAFRLSIEKRGGKHGIGETSPLTLGDGARRAGEGNIRHSETSVEESQKGILHSAQDDNTRSCEYTDSIPSPQRGEGRISKRGTSFRNSGEGYNPHARKDNNVRSTVKTLLTSKKAAFTLAEVLITLGVIGVVAAVTMPTVIANHKKKALEVAFKKSYANFYNAYNKAMINDPSLLDDDVVLGDDTELSKAIYAEYVSVKNVDSELSGTYRNNVRTYTLKKGVRPECSQLFKQDKAVITPDGSAVSIMRNCGTNYWVTIDTNGLSKGPNAYGHDLFIFTISKEGKFEPATYESEGIQDEDGNWSYNDTEENKDKCSKTASSNINGVACGNFALANKCPYDTTKTYWECLP